MADCNKCANKKLSSYSATCVECGLARKGFKPMTNADRIRAMTDEELANLINRIEPKFCHDGWDYMIGCDVDKDCVVCWLEWLKQEVTIKYDKIDEPFKGEFIKSWRVGEPLREEDFFEEEDE